MLLFWLSLALFGIVEVQHHRPDLRPIAMGMTVLFLVGLVWTQPAFVRAGLASVSPRRAAMTALLANVDDPASLGAVYPRPDRPKDLAVELRARHLAMFADEWSTWLGTPLINHIRLGDPAQCRGSIDQVTRLPVPGPAQWRGSGWAWDNARQVPPDRVVVADNAGRVVGYALGGYPPKLGSGGPKRSGWRGHFTADNAATVRAYVLVDSERTACPLARMPEVR